MYKIVSRFLIIALFSSFLFSACDDSGAPSKKPVSGNKVEKTKIMAPAFNADSAFKHIEAQLAFGPRVPNTAAHAACAQWLAEALEAAGAEVSVQPAVVNGWDLDGNQVQLSIQNIFGAFNPQSNRRIMLSAHWDTRPYADAGPEEKARTPIPGANDGASGVAVLLEIARVLGEKAPGIGVDIALWDGEDHGNTDIQNSYCLGSQHWSSNRHKPGYQAMYGINLDMVGGPNAYFRKDQVSVAYASPIVDKVWAVASELGYGQYFPSVKGGSVVDDHAYLNEFAKIPFIDIIDQPNHTDQLFFSHWHTLEDDIQHISKETLKAVGQTVLEVVYREN